MNEANRKNRSLNNNNPKNIVKPHSTKTNAPGQQPGAYFTKKHEQASANLFCNSKIGKNNKGWVHMLYTNIRNLIAKQALGNTIHTLHYTSLQKKKKNALLYSSKANMRLSAV